MKKLLIISTNFPPSISIGTQRILRICKFLDPANWGVSILTLKENYYPDLSHRTDDDKDELLAKLKIHRTGKVDPVFYLLNLRESLRGKSNGAPNANGAAKPRPKPKQDPGNEGTQDYSAQIKQKKVSGSRSRIFLPTSCSSRIRISPGCPWQFGGVTG